MKVRTGTSPKKRTEMLCAFVLERPARALGLGRYDSKVTAAISQAAGDTGGKLGHIATVAIAGKAPAKRILLAGIGRREDITEDTLRHASGKIAQRARELKLKEFTVVCPPSYVADQARAAGQIVEGAKMALYKFESFREEKAGSTPDLTVVASSPGRVAKAAKAASTAADGAVFAKELGNLPPNECAPATLAGIARSVSKKNKLKCTVLSKAELKRRGFGGITAVGQGSRNEPKLIVIEYDGRRGSRPIMLVGKAVTFDTGGISLKPGASMDEMKFDKCGGCTVLGIMKAASELRLPVNLVGIIPSVENMPGGGAYRPGDIIKLYGGKTAEILNTDAEGRLILADALSYGEEHYAPRAIIDFATLTGACIVALGNNVAGMVSNDPKLAGKIRDSSARTAEEVWELPLNDDYMEQIKSEVADIKNMGNGKAAGTIAAAAFLRSAIKDTPWVHLDIAGVAWTQAATKKRSYNPKGATGFGVRLVLDYLQNP